MNAVTPLQVKMARAALDWSQQDLGTAAGVSAQTISNFESGDMSVRGATLKGICQTLERAGVEFTDGDGVRRRRNNVRFFEGMHAQEKFFAEIANAFRQRKMGQSHRDVMCAFTTPESLTRACGIGRNPYGWLEELGGDVAIRCLVPRDTAMPSVLSPVDCRMVPVQNIGPASYIIYGDRYANVLAGPRGFTSFIVFDLPLEAAKNRAFFLSLWSLTPPGIPMFPTANRHSHMF